MSSDKNSPTPFNPTLHEDLIAKGYSYERRRYGPDDVGCYVDEYVISPPGENIRMTRVFYDGVVDTFEEDPYGSIVPAKVNYEVHDALTKLGFRYEQGNGEDRYTVPPRKYVDLLPQDGKMVILMDGFAVAEVDLTADADVQLIIKG